MLVDVHQSKHAVIEHKHVEVRGHPPEQRPSPGGRSFAKVPTPDILDTLQRKPPPSEPRDARSVDAPPESDHAVFSARPVQDGIGRSLASAREDGFNPRYARPPNANQPPNRRAKPDLPAREGPDKRPQES